MQYSIYGSGAPELCADPGRRHIGNEMITKTLSATCLGLGLLFGATLSASGQPAGPEQQTGQEAAPEVRSSTPGGQSAVQPGEEAATGFWSRANLFGDPGGVRARLKDKGVTFGLLETAEVLGNPTGGTRRAVVFEGLLAIGLGIDTGKAFGLDNGTFNVSAYQIHGRGLSQNALGNNLMTVSSLEAERGFLLFELWYEHTFLDGKLAIRAGQMAADQEFMTSSYAGLFLNHTFGWSTFPSVNLPSGGPAYPLAAPGIRVRIRPTDELTILAAAFNGDPAGPGSGTPQSRDRAGANFRVRDEVLGLLEVQYALNQGDNAPGLPGTYKLGAYVHNGRFADQRRNSTGLSLADPLGTDAQGRARRRDYALYAVADQLVWRPQGAKDAGLGVFARVMGGPGDRNLINFYLDAGVTYKGLVPTARPTPWASPSATPASATPPPSATATPPASSTRQPPPAATRR